MDISKIKEEVYKCSKCGLCQSVCPIFLSERNEMYLARGRYVVLNNFFKNKKPLSKKFINELDICLNCNACKEFCPSSINSGEIFTYLKSIYYKPFPSFWFKYKLILLYNFLKKIFIKNNLYEVRVKENTFHYSVKKADVVYFQGCFNRYINPTDKNASMQLLKQNGYNVKKVINNCCGLPILSDGNLRKFDKNSKKIINSIPKTVKYVVVSCDSCYKTLFPIFKDTEYKLIKIDELITNTKMRENVFYHKPYSREEYNGILPIINKKGNCAISENFFMFKHKELSQRLLEKVFYTKSEIEGKTIVTTCNITKWGLIEGVRKKGINAKICSLSEFIIN